MSHLSQTCGCDPHHGLVCWAHSGVVVRQQTDDEIVKAATDPENLKALVQAFQDHRQSIREHEESRKEGR